MPAGFKSFISLLLGSAAMFTCVARIGESQAQTPAEKKALDKQKKALENLKKKALADKKKRLMTRIRL